VHFQGKRRGWSTQRRCSEWGYLGVNGCRGGANGSSGLSRMSRILNGLGQFTASVKVVVCESEPEVAVTVIV